MTDVRSPQPFQVQQLGRFSSHADLFCLRNFLLELFQCIFLLLRQVSWHAWLLRLRFTHWKRLDRRAADARSHGPHAIRVQLYRRTRGVIEENSAVFDTGRKE